MKETHPRARLAAACIVALAFAAGPAGAFDAQLFSPAVDPQGYFSVYSSRTAPRGRFHIAAWYNWADDPVEGDVVVPGGLPLPLPLPGGGTTTQTVKVVDSIHTIDLVGSYSVLDWLELGLDIPISDVSSDVPGVKESTGIDDIRVIAKFQLLDSRERGFGLGIVPFVEFPTGERRRLTSNEEFDFGGIGVADYVYQRFHTALNFGYRANDKPFDDDDEADEFIFGLGAGVLAIKDQPLLGGFVNHMEVLGEVYGSTSEDDAFSDEFSTPVEALGGFRLYNPSGFYFTAGVGQALTDSVNGAAVRVVASIGYTPPPPPPPPPPPAPAPPPPPPQPQVVVTDEQIVTLEPVYFDFDKDTIKPVSYPVLDQVVQVMRDRPTTVVRVEGHTDSMGSDTYNERLSEKRSHSVVRYMIGKGIEANRLQAAGFGESRPIATNDTAEGRAKNRRTEFHIIQETR